LSLRLTNQALRHENLQGTGYILRGADKGLVFCIFLFAVQPKEFFLDGLKKLEQRSHKFMELRGEYVNTFNPVACYILYKAKDLSTPLVDPRIFDFCITWR
jgi:hypothetical protein